MSIFSAPLLAIDQDNTPFFLWKLLCMVTNEKVVSRTPLTPSIFFNFFYIKENNNKRQMKNNKIRQKIKIYYLFYVMKTNMYWWIHRVWSEYTGNVLYGFLLLFLPCTVKKPYILFNDKLKTENEIKATTAKIK